MKKIVAICGSTRQSSSNLNLLRGIEALFKGEFEVSYYLDIGKLPQFNPDSDIEPVPAPVAEFRKQLRSADGFIICTPEYAHGVPGALKNAIDWTVSSSEFNRQPVLLITASTDGQFGHRALLETLKAIDTKNTEELQLLIPFVKTKVNENGIINEDTKKEVIRVVKLLLSIVETKAKEGKEFI